MAETCYRLLLENAEHFIARIETDSAADEHHSGVQVLQKFDLPVMQGFNWECAHRPQPPWYAILAGRAVEMRSAGITAVWLPPPSVSVSTEVRVSSSVPGS